MASLTIFVILAALCAVHGKKEESMNANETWTAEECYAEYNDLSSKLTECQGDENPSLISWGEAETALFLLLAVVVVLLLLFCIITLNYCAEKGSKKEDKAALVA